MPTSTELYQAKAEEALIAARHTDDQGQRIKYLDRAASYATLAERARDPSGQNVEATATEGER